VRIVGFRYHAGGGSGPYKKDFDLCVNCFLEGRFPETMSSADFVKLDTAPFKHDKSENWSDQETVCSAEKK